MNRELKINQAKEYINQIAERYKIEINSLTTRQSLINNQYAGMGLDAKRSKAWCEYGYPERVTFDHAYRAYRRGGIAFSAIDKTIRRSWINTPIIKDEADADQESEWELKVSSVFNTNLYLKFKEADRRRMIGKYSGLLLYFSDYPKKEGWQTKPKANVSLNKAEPVWENCLTPIYSGTDIQYWQVSIMGANGVSSNIINVHPSRILILGDYTEDGMSSLEAGFNNLVDIEKILGGGGESFAKNAARQLLVNFAKDVELDGIAEKFGIESSDLESHFNAVVQDINTGNDTMMITQGANVETLTTNVPDPLNHFQVNLSVFASTFGIPQTILLGNNEGERASTENEKQWSLTCEERRDGLLTQDITRLVDMLMDRGAIPMKAKFIIEWERLVSATATERMDIADKMASVIQKTFGMFGGNEVVSINELREAMNLEPIEIKESLPDDIDAFIPFQ